MLQFVTDPKLLFLLRWCCQSGAAGERGSSDGSEPSIYAQLSHGGHGCLQSCKSLVSTEDQEYLNVELPEPDGSTTNVSILSNSNDEDEDDEDDDDGEGNYVNVQGLQERSIGIEVAHPVYPALWSSCCLYWVEEEEEEEEEEEGEIEEMEEEEEEEEIEEEGEIEEMEGEIEEMEEEEGEMEEEGEIEEGGGGGGGGWTGTSNLPDLCLSCTMLT
ncbi:hypothetical protein D4764_18G0013180 [Takifugu flavidus]|uniref:Uncharacterized protein n=1 Tax=Takifugu flavidus TaxID=433684 RepID=A0A5C6NSM0_9TELE|nr:hypothetical protein D4764_18G0013180 [Takifugu flavidus]